MSDIQKRILLTGSTGFIGRKLGVELSRRGYRVIALVRDIERADLPFPAEKILWQSAFNLRDIDAVVHLAGESIGEGRWSKRQKEKIVSSRTQTTEKLQTIIDSIEGRKPDVLVSASAIGIYGNRGDELLTEESSPGKGFLAETCLAWEAAAAELGEKVRRVVLMRTGIVLGRHGGALQKILPLFKRGVGGKLGSGAQWMSWIHLEDLVRLYVHAIEDSQMSGPVNCVAPNPVTNADFTGAVSKALNAPAFFPAPAFGLKLVLGEMSALLLDSQRVREKLESYNFQFRFAKIGDALLSITKDVEKSRGLSCQEYLGEVWLPVPPENVFAFLADLKNMEKVFPPSLELKVLSRADLRLREGRDYEYSLRRHSISVKCSSHIIDWVENHRFSSTHRKGPFHLWFHSRNLERIASGTLLTDRVIYQHKLGYFGDLFGQLILGSGLKNCFRFRGKQLMQILAPGE